MSASLIVLIPIVLLGLVTTLCFVGCAFQTGGVPADLGPYQSAIVADMNLVALWPLDDQVPTDNSMPVAHDVASHPVGVKAFDGKYTGTFMLQQMPGIVPGDTNQHDPTPCAIFDSGGRVEVPFHQELNAAPFTIECWVQPAWPASDMNLHAVVATFDTSANTGYALFCDDKGFWGGSIGLGPGASPPALQTMPAASSQPATLGVTTYLALIFDGKEELSLFVNPVGTPFNMTPYAQASLASLPVGSMFVPSGGNLPLFIAGGAPNLPTSMLVPFRGKIQDVAFYKAPLGTQDLQAHFNLGNTG